MNKEAQNKEERCERKVALSWQRFLLPNIHMDGWKFVGIASGIAFVLCFFSDVLGFMGLLVAVFVYFFFRDPERVTPVGDNLIIAPADGTVNSIVKVVPPAEMDIGKEPVYRISIFLSLFNVHINRVPATGKITKQVYVAGKFLNASLDKASAENERNLVSMKTAYGNNNLGFVQIAGLIARRILGDLTVGQEVKSGQKFGLMRFGSRMDVYLPEGIEPMVDCGQETIGGETVIADMSVKTGRKGVVR